MRKYSDGFNEKFNFFLKSYRTGLLTFCGEDVQVQYDSNGVNCKVDEIIDESNTFITKENGFKNICMLDKGTSPIAFLEALDTSGVERFEELDCVTYLD